MRYEDDVHFQCPACLSGLRAEASLAGCLTQCPYCGCGVEVPESLAGATPSQPVSRPTASIRRPEKTVPRRKTSVKTSRPARRVTRVVSPGPAVREMRGGPGAEFWLWSGLIVFALVLITWAALSNNR